MFLPLFALLVNFNKFCPPKLKGLWKTVYCVICVLEEEYKTAPAESLLCNTVHVQ
jgi:hypothetical protein